MLYQTEKFIISTVKKVELKFKWQTSYPPVNGASLGIFVTNSIAFIIHHSAIPIKSIEWFQNDPMWPSQCRKH